VNEDEDGEEYVTCCTECGAMFVAGEEGWGDEVCFECGADTFEV